MKKVCVIVANVEIDKIKDYENTLSKIFAQKYEFNLIFVHQDEKPVQLKISKNLKLVQNKGSYNQQIRVAFEQIDDTMDCVILCDMNIQNVEEYINQMLKQWNLGTKIIRLKKEQDKIGFFGKIAQFFSKLKHSIYNLALYICGYNKSRFCYNTFQLFDKQVYPLIKAIPEKNAYLRNHEVLTNFDTIELTTEENIKLKNDSLTWNVKTITSLVLAVLFVVAFTLSFVLYPISKSNGFGLTFSVSMLVLCLSFVFFSITLFFSAVLEQKINND